jgi:hypothetical protein
MRCCSDSSCCKCWVSECLHSYANRSLKQRTDGSIYSTSQAKSEETAALHCDGWWIARIISQGGVYKSFLQLGFSDAAAYIVTHTERATSYCSYDDRCLVGAAEKQQGLSTPAVMEN